MVLDHGPTAHTATPRPWAFAKNGGLQELDGFILSRRVEDCSPETLKSYSHRIGQFFRYILMESGVCSVGDMNRSHIERYLLYLRAKGCSPHYIHANFRSLRSFFNWCIEEEFINESPMRNMKPPRLPRQGKPFLSQEQRNQMLRVCPLSIFTGARNAAIIWLLWTTGMRLSELTGLELHHLDWDNSRIRVFGKGRKERYVPFTKDAKKAVWRYLRYRHDGLPQLWLTEERRPAMKSMVISATRRILQRADLHVKDMHHIFRRSWAMRNLKAGVPIKYVQLVGGWESVVTLEGYVRAMESEDALSVNWV